jgi:hypothetical protein
MPSLPDIAALTPDLATLLAAVLGFVAAFFQTLWRLACAPFSGLRRRIALAWHSRALYDALVRLDAHLASAGASDPAAVDDAIALLAKLAPKASTALPEAAVRESVAAPKPRRSRRAKRKAGLPLKATQAGQITA